MALAILNTPQKYSVNTDLEHSSLDLSVFTDGENFKLTNRGIETFNGAKTISMPYSAISVELWNSDALSWDFDDITWEASDPANSGFVFYIFGNLESYYLVAGRTKVNIFDGTNWSSISPDIEYLPNNIESEFTWTGLKFGSYAILNTPNGGPLYWGPAIEGVSLKPLNFKPGKTWQSLHKSAQVIRGYKNFLFALNLQEDSKELPYSYRWSHPADTNGLPFTWDETDLSSIAGKESLDGAGGSIVDGLMLRDSFVIYSERAITVLDFVGGEFIWQARSLTNSYGLLATNCVVEVMGIHYFMTDSDIMFTDGNSISSLLHNIIRTKFRTTLNKDAYRKSFVCVNYSSKEIWFCYPSISNLCDKAIVYNWLNNYLSVRDLDNIVSCAVGPKLKSSESWDEAIGIWEDDFKTWSTAFSTYFDNEVSGLQANGRLLNLEQNTVNVEFNTKLEKLSFILDEAVDIASSTINMVYPRIHCAGKVKMQFGSQDNFFDKINWGEEFEFYPETSKQVEPRSGAGKYHSFRIFSVDDKPFVFVGMTISFISRGQR